MPSQLLPANLPACQPACLPTCLPANLSACQPACLPISLSYSVLNQDKIIDGLFRTVLYGTVLSDYRLTYSDKNEQLAKLAIHVHAVILQGTVRGSRA
jgi:hypothetical protein